MLVTATKEGLESFLPFQYCYLHSATVLIVPSLSETTAREQLCVCEPPSIPGFTEDPPALVLLHLSCPCGVSSMPNHTRPCGSPPRSSELTRGYLCVAEARITVRIGKGCRVAYFNDSSGVWCAALGSCAVGDRGSQICF